MPKNFRKSTALVKRVKALEVKQRADDKAQERKVQYYRSPHALDSTWGANFGFAMRTSQGTSGEGNTSAGENRIGNTVNLRSMKFKFWLQLSKNSDGVPIEVNTSTICRIILADNLTDDTGLVATDLLQDPTSYPITSPYKNKVAGGKRYRILMDKVVTISGRQSDKVFNYNMPLPKSGRVVHYDGDLSINPSDLNLSLIYVCDATGPTSGNKPQLNMYNIARFEDA